MCVSASVSGKLTLKQVVTLTLVFKFGSMRKTSDYLLSSVYCIAIFYR